MTSGGSNFNDFPGNEFTKFRAAQTVKANRDHGVPRVFCSKQDFSVFTTVNINSLYTNTITK